MEDAFVKAKRPLPVNKNHSTDPHNDKLLRFLDCTVIEYMHARIEEQYKKDKSGKGFSHLKVFDSTRGVFMEGERIYSGAEIFEKSHIQICIWNSNCIKGFSCPEKK